MPTSNCVHHVHISFCRRETTQRPRSRKQICFKSSVTSSGLTCKDGGAWLCATCAHKPVQARAPKSLRVDESRCRTGPDLAGLALVVVPEIDEVVHDLGYPTPANAISVHARSIGVNRLRVDRALTDAGKMTAKNWKVSVRKRWRGEFRPHIRLLHAGSVLRANAHACGPFAVPEPETKTLGTPLLECHQPPHRSKEMVAQGVRAAGMARH